MTRELDELDIRILKVLAKEGRISWTELAERISLSQTPTLRRVRALEKEGFITGYQAVIDEARVGKEVSVFTSVTLERQTEEGLKKFCDAVKRLPQVMDCYMMTGETDFLLRIAVSDLNAFQAFTTKLIAIDGVARVSSSVAVESVIQRVSPI